jgi:outer membrane protein insertion porin family
VSSEVRDHMKSSKLVFSYLFLLGCAFLYADEGLPTIKKITVEGNKHVKTEAIVKRLPYKVGEAFDPEKSAQTIKNLYGLGNFRQIKIEREDIGEKEVNVYVVVDERKLLEGIEFKGNTKIKSKKIRSELKLEKVETIDEEQLSRLSTAIQELYRQENFHLVNVEYSIIDNKESPDKAKILFTITEGKRALIKRIYFRGNKHLPDRKLRTVIFSREDWLLGFADDSGKYNEQSLEMDKRRIEYYYRDYGYLMAKVAGAEVEFSKDNTEIVITFDIREGDKYTVRYISVPGDEIFNENELLPYVTLLQGKPYNQSAMLKSIEALKAQWGEIGYIYADISPQIVPKEETKEVDVTFHVEKGKKMFVNRIDITGNKVTKDRVIRRELEIEEGDLITSKKLKDSKNSVEYLGFFEPGTVNWQIHRRIDDRADLEMKLKEAKTGKANFAVTYGSDKNSASRGVRFSLGVEKGNFLGRGWDIGGGVQTSLHRFKSGSVYFLNPHVFDTDVSTAYSLYVKHDEYETWKSVEPIPVEKIYGGSFGLGFALPIISRKTRAGIEIGAEHIRNNSPKARSGLELILQPIVDRTFQAGDLIWFGGSLSQDTRNHRIYPSRGYKVIWSMKAAPPGTNNEFNFVKSEIDWSWYTPLIGENKLVLMLHAAAGLIDRVSGGKGIIPYKELFHMGGQDTVRGFAWGAIGPSWRTYASENPLGGRKAVQFNTELIFPIVPDYQMKGFFFYDAGAGWDTPKYGMTSEGEAAFLKKDKFNMRHSVGFGLNLSSPFPAKIAWGYKLDRDKASGESPSEFHLSMNKAW